MKKLFALLSLFAFLAVSASAQEPQAKEETKKEASVSKSEGKAAASCCVKANPSCCKSGSKEAKNCTPEQKAACAKAGKETGCTHAKADASEDKESKSDMK